MKVRDLCFLCVLLPCCMSSLSITEYFVCKIVPLLNPLSAIWPCVQWHQVTGLHPSALAVYRTGETLEYFILWKNILLPFKIMAKLPNVLSLSLLIMAWRALSLLRTRDARYGSTVVSTFVTDCLLRPAKWSLRTLILFIIEKWTIKVGWRLVSGPRLWLLWWDVIVIFSIIFVVFKSLVKRMVRWLCRIHWFCFLGYLKNSLTRCGTVSGNPPNPEASGRAMWYLPWRCRFFSGTSTGLWKQTGDGGRRRQG